MRIDNGASLSEWDTLGEFDFLIGWDAIKHYKLRVDHVTGALSGTDFEGNKFTTMSQYQFAKDQAAWLGLGALLA